MEDEEYELMPHHELEKLKSEIEDLKHHPLGETPSGNELLHAVQELNQSVKALTSIFKIAAEQLSGKPHEETTTHRFDPMAHKINELIEQNKKLAAGIVSVADLVKEKAEKEEADSQPMSQGVSPGETDIHMDKPPEMSNPPDFDLGPPANPPADDNMGPPPMPPPEMNDKKKGLFKL